MGFAPYDNAIAAVGNAFGKMFDVFKTNKEHQAETELLNENKTYEKAIDYAEKIIDMVELSNGYFTESNLRDFRNLKRKFDKYKR